LTLGEAKKDEAEAWLEAHVLQLQDGLSELLEQDHSYNYVPEGYTYDHSKYSLRAFTELNDRFQEIVAQMTGSYDAFVNSVEDNIDTHKTTKKNELDDKTEAAKKSLSTATVSFGESIEFIRETLETKADEDQLNI